MSSTVHQGHTRQRGFTTLPDDQRRTEPNWTSRLLNNLNSNPSIKQPKQLCLPHFSRAPIGQNKGDIIEAVAELKLATNPSSDFTLHHRQVTKHFP